MEAAKTCLVIDSRKLDTLRMDGPALRIRLHAQSSRLFPLRRLSRIHVMGTVQHGFEALLHCAEQQIPVAFFTVHGKLRCQLYFPVFENGVLAHWLDHVDFDTRAREQYDEWLHNQTLHIISLMGFCNGPHKTRRQLLEEKLRAICKRRLGAGKFRNSMEWLNGMLAAHLSQIIVQHGLSNQSRGKRKLMEDITPLCELWILYYLAEISLARKDFSVNAHSVAEFYQQSSERIEYTVRCMLAQLSSRMESII